MSLDQAFDRQAVISRFLEHCHRRTFPAKTVIINAGDYSDELYYLVKGSVSVLIEDDDGHVLRRGERSAVCAKTYGILTSEPYAAQVVPVPPHTAVPEAEQPVFDCARSSLRDPRESKGTGYRETRKPGTSDCC